MESLALRRHKKSVAKEALLKQQASSYLDKYNKIQANMEKKSSYLKRTSKNEFGQWLVGWVRPKRSI